MPMGTYTADNGTLELLPGRLSQVLPPGHVPASNIYYKMKCPNPVPGTYLFILNDILGPNCKPICVKTGQLPLKSAVKTIEPHPAA